MEEIKRTREQVLLSHIKALKLENDELRKVRKRAKEKRGYYLVNEYERILELKRLRNTEQLYKELLAGEMVKKENLKNYWELKLKNYSIIFKGKFFFILKQLKVKGKTLKV